MERSEQNTRCHRGTNEGAISCPQGYHIPSNVEVAVDMCDNGRNVVEKIDSVKTKCDRVVRASSIR